MADKLKYRYSIVRFMPNQLRGEFVNVGIVLHVLDTRQLLSEWLPDLGRMRCLYPDVTLDQYRHFRTQLSERYRPKNQQLTLGSQSNLAGEPFTQAAPELLDYLHSEFSVPFQFSEPIGGLTYDPDEQLKRLYLQLVEPGQTEQIEKPDSNALAKVRRHIERQLSHENLLADDKFRKNIEVPGKTRAWPFDFGYLNGSATMLQTLALDQLDPIKKANAAIILNGHVNDVRAGNYQNPTVYVIILISPNSARQDGVEEAVSLIEGNNIETLSEEELPKITGELKRIVSRTNHFTASR